MNSEGTDQTAQNAFTVRSASAATRALWIRLEHIVHMALFVLLYFNDNCCFFLSPWFVHGLSLYLYYFGHKILVKYWSHLKTVVI